MSKDLVRINNTNKQLVPKRFLDDTAAKDVLSSERYEEGLAALHRGDKFTLAPKEMWKLAWHNDGTKPPLANWGLIIGVLGGCASGFGLSVYASNFSNTAMSLLIVACFVLPPVVLSTVVAPALLYRGLRSTQEKEQTPYLKTIRNTLYHLENLEVWKDVKNFPMVERFDTKKVLDNAKEMSDEIDYQFYNFGTNPEDCQNFSNLKELSESLVKVLEDTRVIQKKFDEMSADQLEAQKVKYQAMARRKLESQNSGPVVDLSTELVKNTQAQNKCIISGADTALELGR